ncbi:MAG: hypothetical protein XD82_0099 [Methanoculleus marisnigri]|uniref:Uncharacterized protein n=1 Tax=Methanoculleus marisnigri TaxID=2198 RepID=A0A101GSI7_9EURY|nr:MAG: hypothetical protein XD82_0099 [Methanoculleus marisnigri]
MSLPTAWDPTTVPFSTIGENPAELLRDGIKQHPLFRQEWASGYLRLFAAVPDLDLTNPCATDDDRAFLNPGGFSRVTPAVLPAVDADPYRGLVRVLPARGEGIGNRLQEPIKRHPRHLHEVRDGVQAPEFVHPLLQFVRLLAERLLRPVPLGHIEGCPGDADNLPLRVQERL